MGSDLDERIAEQLEVLAEKLSKMEHEMCSAALRLHTNAVALANDMQKDQSAPDDRLNMKRH